MGKTKRKSLQVRRRDEDRGHWLGAGLAGQDSLLFDLDPYLYAADSVLSKTISQVAHHYDGENGKALIAICPAPETLPWHSAYLRSHCDVCICAPVDDPLLEFVEESFNVTIFSESVPHSLQGQADIVLFTEAHWKNLSTLEESLHIAEELLADDGRALFVLQASGEEPNLTLSWDDPYCETVADLVASRIFSKFKIAFETVVPLATLNAQRDFGVGEFAKRHKDFFGKNARELCLSRVYEEDFQREIADSLDRHAVVLTVEM